MSVARSPRVQEGYKSYSFERETKYKKKTGHESDKNILAIINDAISSNATHMKNFVFKPISYTVSWIKHIRGEENVSKELSAIGSGAKSTKNWIELTVLPGKVVRFVQNLWNFQFTEAFFSATECVGPAHDLFSEIAGTVLHASKQTIRVFSKINYVALLIGQGKALIVTIMTVAKEKLTGAQQFLLTLNGGKSLSFCLLAGTGLILGNAAGVALLVFSTSALIFSNVHYIYDKVAEPNKLADR
jgi:hypothetical protein